MHVLAPFVFTMSLWPLDPPSTLFYQATEKIYNGRFTVIYRSETREPLPKKHFKRHDYIMRIGTSSYTSTLWVYPFTVILLLPACILAQVPASGTNDNKVVAPKEDVTSHQGK